MRMRVPRAVAMSCCVAIVAIAGVALTACGSSDEAAGGSGPSEPVTVGFATQSMKEALFVELAEFVEKKGEELNAEVLVGDADTDPTKQLEIIQTWLRADQIDALFILPVDIEALNLAIDQALEEDIPVVALNLPGAETQAGLVNITWDFHEWGYKIGKSLVQCIDERLGGEAKVAILGGPNLPGPTVVKRIEGEKDAITELAPEAEIVAEQNGEGQRLVSLDVMTNILQANPNVNAVTGTNDDSMIGVVKAFEQAGIDPKEVCIAGGDGTPEGIANVRSGDFYSTLDIGYLKMGELGMEALASMARGEEASAVEKNTITLPTKSVTKDNLPAKDGG